MDALLQNAFCIFNLCEGLLWVGIAVGFAVVFARKRRNPDLMLATGLLFLAYGVSDFVEIRTGGWYKPWSLLLWKVCSILGFAIMYRLFRNRRKSSTAETA
jgi:lipopolysaccharide export LptBFGC system permease protein LptF